MNIKHNISFYGFRKILQASLVLLLVTACEFIDNVPAKSGENVEALRKAASEFVENGDEREAVVAYDQLIEINPDDAMAYNGKAVVFDNAGNHNAAQDLYKAAMLLAPDSVAIKNNLAMSFILNKQPKKAVELLRPLFEKAKDNAVLRHNLAMAYGVLGQKEKALKLNMMDMSKAQALANQKIYDEMAAKNGSPPREKLSNKPKEPNKTSAITDKKPKVKLAKSTTSTSQQLVSNFLAEVLKRALSNNHHNSVGS